MKTIDIKYVERIIRSVKARKSHDYMPAKLSASFGGAMFLLVFTASLFSKRQDIDFIPVYVSFALTPLFMFVICKLVVRCIEGSRFMLACQHIVLRRWEFVFHYARKHPHTKKFYSNPADLLLMAIVLKADGYIDESTLVLEKATSLHPEFEGIYASSPDLNKGDIQQMVNVWKG